MPDTFHSEIVAPVGAFAPRAAALVLGLGALGGWAYMLANPVEAPRPTVLSHLPLSAEPTSVEADGRETLVAAPGPEVSLVLSAGGTSYIQLGDVIPAYADPVLHHVDGQYAAVAAVNPQDVPLEHRGWLERRVVVDGGCEANVVGFAVVSRLVGDPGYASVDTADWTVETVFQQGAQVLAAQLSGCTGTLARAAELSPIVRPVEVSTEPALEAAARARLIASNASSVAQEDWSTSEQPGTWFDYSGTEFSTRVVLHPVTGTRFISVHGTFDGGCSGPSANVWGLYRIDRGSLVTIEERALDDMMRIDDLIDVDGDGSLELLGSDWMGLGRLVTRTTGEQLARTGMQFYGCSC